MLYSYIDRNVEIKKPVLINAGIYKEDENDNFSGKPWGNDFLKKKLEPTAEIYAKEFYAKNHIPSSFRPGNNSKLLEYDYYDVENYNVKCFNNTLNTNQVLI
jgi:hypothetical protein|tara:strand:- start:5262 stop:5567 length:306 start_codon:yes stop_codon:yes gene_type:complete